MSNLMMYGPLPPRALPQQNTEMVRLCADRFWRASQAQQEWAKVAKECTDFFEGRQWTEKQLRALEKAKRPALVFNKIAPLVRLVLGYMRNNRTDISYLPANEGPATSQVGDIITQIMKQVSEVNQMPWVDAEVFMDGIVTGRGFYDTRLNFDENELGEIVSQALDPFCVYVDPDCDKYDLDKGAKFLDVTRWLSYDDVGGAFGEQAAALVRPFIGTSYSQTWGGFPFMDMSSPEITPRRTFGATEDPTLQPFADFFHTEMIDPTRKMIRCIDMQHKLRVMSDVLIDLETGDKLPVPGDAELAVMFPDIPKPQRRDNFISKAMYHAERMKNPLVLAKRPIERVRWTVMIGDILVHDDWSPYSTYTVQGYFPYFRRGVTRGMVEDMLDPQREINRRRGLEIEIVGRTAQGGWLLNKDSLTKQEEENFRQNSSLPGFIGTYRGDPTKKPEKIEASPPPTSMERLEQKATDDLRSISGINESALGELDRVQSGRAIEARQRQAVIAIQMYMDNFSRTKELYGRKGLELIQNFYTEERVFRIIGDGGKIQQFTINQRVMAPGTPDVIDRLNDVTLGRYTVAVDETPLSASFANAQFEEMLNILEKLGPVGQALASTRPDLLVDLSSLPRKEEWAQAIQQAMQAPPPGAVPPGAPPGGGPGMPAAAPGAPPSIAASPGGPGAQVIPMPAARAG